jgi:acyl-CoA synthetase (AMP-forming)/AMP-acid ligase II
MATAPLTRPHPELPCAPTAPALIRWSTAAFADEELVVLGDERLRFGDAGARSAALARSLLAEGVGKGTRVGVLAPNGPDAYVALMAVTRIGAVAVPINTFFVASELAWVLEDADIQVLLTVPSLLGNDYLARLEDGIPGLRDQRGPELSLPALPYLRRVHILGDAERQWAAALPEPTTEDRLAAAEERVSPADDHFVIYSSGSTARPKGVIHTHGPTIRQAWFIASQHDWGAGDRIYTPLPFFWIGGYIYAFLASLQNGWAAICELRFEPGETLRMLERERVTATLGWPHVGPGLAGHPDFAATDLSRLKGPYHWELLAPELRMPDPGLQVYPLGMTETATSHTWWPAEVPLPAEKRGSVGQPAEGWEHKIVDEDGAEVPVGVDGEICVRGGSLMRGIVGRERDETFDADGYYHTADAGHLDEDGFVYFIGRMGDLVKTAGASVSPIEVESVLKAMPEVREASVVGVPDAEVGQRVCGVVVLHDGATLDADELRSRCRRELSAYKVPKQWVFLDLDQIPYSASDKVDKAKLVEQIKD